MNKKIKDKENNNEGEQKYDDIGILEEESEDDRKWRQGLRKRFHHL